MFPKNKIQQSYWQFSNQGRTKYEEFSLSPTILSPSCLSQNHLINLTNYRNYIKQQMKFLGTQAQRDEAQMILIELRIQQMNAFFLSQFEGLKNKLNVFHHKYKETIEQRDYLEQKNFKKVSQLKQKFQQQEKLRQKQSQIKKQNQKIKKQVMELKGPTEDGKAIIQSKMFQIYHRQQKIKQNDETILKNQLSIKQLKQYSKRIAQNTENKKIILKQTKQSIKIRQDFLFTLKKEKQQQQQQLSSIKNKILESKKIKQQIQVKKLHIIKNLQQEVHLNQLLQKQKDILNYKLQVSLLNLQAQQRGRQKQQEKLNKIQIIKQKSEKELKGLKQYLKQLLQSNYMFQDLLKKFNKRDITLTTALLDRLSSEEQQKIKCHQEIKNKVSQDPFINYKINTFQQQQSRQNKTAYFYERFEPKQTKIQTIKVGSYAKFNTMPRQDYIKETQNLRAKQNLFLDNQNNKLKYKQIEQSILRSHSSNLLEQYRHKTSPLIQKINERQLQRTASSQYQGNFRQQMPKKVQQIINKYKNKQNLSYLNDVLVANKTVEDEIDKKYDRYTNVRPKILDQLMNYRPSAHNRPNQTSTANNIQI